MAHANVSLASGPVLFFFSFFFLMWTIFKAFKEFVTVNYKLALSKSTSQWLNNKRVCQMPLWRLNPMRLQLLVDLQQLLREFRVGWALCALGNLVGQIFPFSSIQSLGHVRLSATPWTAACQASLSIINCQSLLKFMSIDSVMPFNHLILCHPLLFPPSIFPSNRIFSSESVLHITWPKYWSFSFSISPSNEYSGLISFKIDWLDLLAVQGTLKSLFQHHSLKASIFQHSAFFIVQLSHLYMTTGKNIALTRWTFVGKVMSLLFNMLSWS